MRKLLTAVALSAISLATIPEAHAGIIIVAPVAQPVCYQQPVITPTLFGYVTTLQTVCQQQPVVAGIVGTYWLHGHRYYYRHYR